MSMMKRQLGTDGPQISAIGLGCMSFAGFFGPTDEATSQDCLAAAVEHGIDFWDTSHCAVFNVANVRSTATRRAQRSLSR